jgi:hypothetical protein
MTEVKEGERKNERKMREARERRFESHFLPSALGPLMLNVTVKRLAQTWCDSYAETRDIESIG